MTWKVAFFVTTCTALLVASTSAAFYVRDVRGPVLVNSRSAITGKQEHVPLVSSTALGMGKGMKKNRNKQADLAKKLALAKQQSGNASEGDSNTSIDGVVLRLSDEEVKERNDRMRFEELLRTKTVSMSDMNDGYLTKEQEEEEITASISGVDRLFEGDPAPTAPFEDLVHIQTSNAIGKTSAARLVTKHKYLIVLSDPRLKSFELRQTMKLLLELPQDIREKLIIVNADGPGESRRWMKKIGLQEKFEVYSDEKMEWMRSYSALGEKRFSISMFIVANEKIQKLAREVDGISAAKTIQNAVSSLDM